jgi:hypothetical protein
MSASVWINNNGVDKTTDNEILQRVVDTGYVQYDVLAIVTHSGSHYNGGTRVIIVMIVILIIHLSQVPH